MNENIMVSKDALINAYRHGDEKTKNIFERLYGEEIFKLNIMERVKSYEDACRVLDISPVLNCPNLCICEKHPETSKMNVHFSFRQAIDKKVIAYLKLCVITAALNEGWEPQYTKGEKRYFPYFYFYTQRELDLIDEDQRAEVFMFDKPIGNHVGAVYANWFYLPTNADSAVGQRLCLKAKELVEYAGKQFIDIYADYYLR